MARTLASDFSGATETDGNLPVFDDDWDFPHPLRDLEHLLQGFLILFDIQITNRNVPCGVVLPGRRGKGSALFPVDYDFRCH